MNYEISPDDVIHKFIFDPWGIGTIILTLLVVLYFAFISYRFLKYISIMLKKTANIEKILEEIKDKLK